MDELIDIYTANRTRTGKTIPREGAFLHEGEYMLYALALLENANGEFLITQRSFDKHWAGGWWEVTGGGVLAGETPRAAIVREVGEETGLDVSGQLIEPIYTYENVDLKRGDNYFVDIFHFHLDFCAADVVLQRSEAIDFRLATWDDIVALNEQGVFLHFDRIRQALTAEGVL